MTLGKNKISKVLEKAQAALDTEEGLSASFRLTIELLIVIITLLVNRLDLDSSNSSKPPSSDSNPPKKKSKKPSTMKTGGQSGHPGSRLEPVSDPDEKVELKIDRRTLPKGDYTDAKPETRQVFDIEIKRVVTEYSAQVLVDSLRNRFVAKFPEGVSQKTQYGPGIKAQVVYDSQSQLIPYDRIVENLADNAEMPISTGSVFNFVKNAYDRLEQFETTARQMLVMSSLLHADETGINIGGKRVWLHSCSSEKWTLFMPHGKRGSEAMDAMAILPFFEGVLRHDHWKPYLKYRCAHSLCNAHHLRELERANEQDGWKWAADLKLLLEAANSKKIEQDGQFSVYYRGKFKAKYRDILAIGDKEMPLQTFPYQGSAAHQNNPNLAICWNACVTMKKKRCDSWTHQNYHLPIIKGKEILE